MKIDKNVPIPSKTSFGKPGYRAMLRELGRTDSTLFSVEIIEEVRKVMSNYFHKKTDLRFISRKESATHVRVWRIQ